MTKEFKEQAINTLVEYGELSHEEVSSLSDEELLNTYCKITGENKEDYLNA